MFVENLHNNLSSGSFVTGASDLTLNQYEPKAAMSLERVCLRRTVKTWESLEQVSHYLVSSGTVATSPLQSYLLLHLMNTRNRGHIKLKEIHYRLQSK
jgi:hypothetical protein